MIDYPESGWLMNHCLRTFPLKDAVGTLKDIIQLNSSHGI